MSRSKELFERSLKVAPGGVHSPVRAFKSVGGTPVFFEKAEGPYLYSVDGRRYIDFCQSFGPNMLGHRDPEVQEQVEKRLKDAWSFGACEPYSLELAEWIIGRVPWVEKLRFVSSGTEAVMSALRLARAATGRAKTLKFEGCYHGHVDNMLVKAGSGLAGEAAADSAGVPQSLAELTLVSPLDDEENLENIFRRHGTELAAVIIEPLPANYGLLEQRLEFLTKVVALARQSGALVIFDEVISGFRAALGGMAERTGLKPDLVTYGKVIGGGFPVGCYGGRADLMNLMAPMGPVYQAGTLSANPVSVTAGMATLKKMETVKIWELLEERTKKFARDVNAGFEKIGAPLQMSTYASLIWIHAPTAEPVRRLEQIPAGHAERFKGFFHSCLDKGLYLAPSGYEVGFVSLAHTDGILNQSRDILLEAAKELNA
jgi:glutamate-1-semialdehyde 2,1-aminomutase